jgi:hypothetical protein
MMIWKGFGMYGWYPILGNIHVFVLIGSVKLYENSFMTHSFWAEIGKLDLPNMDMRYPFDRCT